MSKNDLLYNAKYELDNYYYTGNKYNLDKAKEYYKQYKQLKGKKIIERLEEN